MAYKQLTLVFSCLLIAISSVRTQELPQQHAQPDAFAGGLFNNSTNMSLSAPYYRNVSDGSVWVFPSSTFDLGARDMSCECFNPDGTCCMPSSTSIAPFCIAQNSTCCGVTYCNPGETCCGNACCPSNTTCTSDPTSPGCCPLSQLCTGPATCYDAASPNCTNTLFPLAQCCPSSIPYCRFFASYGLGCFASSTLAIAAAVPSEGVTPITHASDPANSTTALTPTTTITFTMTVLPLGSGKFTLEAPSAAASTATGNPLAGTTWEIDIPPLSTSISSTIPPLTTTNITSTTPITTSASTSPVSALCFNPTLETDLPCLATSTPSSLSSTSPYNYAPPGISTVLAKSQSNTLTPPYLFTVLLRINAFLESWTPSLLLAGAICRVVLLLALYLELRWGAGDGGVKGDVEGDWEDGACGVGI